MCSFQECFSLIFNTYLYFAINFSHFSPLLNLKFFHIIQFYRNFLHSVFIPTAVFLSIFLPFLWTHSITLYGAYLISYLLCCSRETLIYQVLKLNNFLHTVFLSFHITWVLLMAIIQKPSYCLCSSYPQLFQSSTMWYFIIWIKWSNLNFSLHSSSVCDDQHE